MVHVCSLFSIWCDLFIIYLRMTEFYTSGKFHGYAKIVLYFAFLPTLACIVSFLQTFIKSPKKDNISYEITLTITSIIYYL